MTSDTAKSMLIIAGCSEEDNSEFSQLYGEDYNVVFADNAANKKPFSGESEAPQGIEKAGSKALPYFFIQHIQTLGLNLQSD